MLLTIAIVSTLLTRSPLVPLSIAYAITAFSLSFIAVRVAIVDKGAIMSYRRVLLLIGVIYAVFAIHVVDMVASGSALASEFVRVAAFVSLTPIALFIVPRLAPAEDFFGILSRVSAVLVLIALPTAVIGEYSLFGITVLPFGGRFGLPIPFVSSTIIEPINSFLDNANALGFLTSVGFAAGFAEIDADHLKPAGWLLLFINFVGAYFTGSRAAVGAVCIAICVYGCYRLFGARITGLCVAVGASLILYLLAVVFGLLPGPPAVASSDLNGRYELWTAIWQALIDQPVFGHGPGDHGAMYQQYINVERQIGQATHNSYLRMFLTTGFVGGIAYLLLTGYWLRLSFRTIGPAKIGLIACTVVIAFHQLWVGFSLFGLAEQSVISAILFGYVIKQSAASNRTNLA